LYRELESGREVDGELDGRRIEQVELADVSDDTETLRAVHSVDPDNAGAAGVRGDASYQCVGGLVDERDVDVGGTKIPKDSMVWVLYAAANHDPSVFPDPDRFDPDRENLAQHLSFSKGTHFCIGAPLARLEARLALEAIVRRLPGLRLVEDQELIYTPSPVGQGVEGLLVTWEQ